MNPNVTLNDGREMPILGFGVFQVPDGPECERAVLEAFEAGYRHIDTAMMYRNEASVGRALQASGLRREKVFLTTKTNSRNLKREAVRQACEQSLSKLGVDFVDLYLIHWPTEDFGEGWEAIQALRDEGKCRSIGVSNITVRRFEQDFFPRVAEAPAVNQIELHVFGQQRELVRYCRAKGIQLVAYSPLARGLRLAHPVLRAAASAHGKTPAQAMIRWLVQQGIVAIPKSTSAERIRENAQVFDFELAPEEMSSLDALNEDLFAIAWRPTGYY
ncbi:MAG: aldo/keto reductase [Candidatus Sumerlaeota bacterium]|nr:aldo/keto reductase [Candidatus Sumerlaeota bacterium]